MWEMLLPLLVATLLFFGILAAVHAAQRWCVPLPRWLRGCLEPPPPREEDAEPPPAKPAARGWCGLSAGDETLD